MSKTAVSIGLATAILAGCAVPSGQPNDSQGNGAILGTRPEVNAASTHALSEPLGAERGPEARTMSTFKLYDSITGYRFEPAGALTSNGFAGVSDTGVAGVCWLPGDPAVTQDLRTNPDFTCGSVKQSASTWITQAVQNYCTAASATAPSLLTWDLEWDFTVALNRTNIQQVAIWAHDQIHATTGPCVGKPVRSGFYGILPTTSWWSSYDKSVNGTSDASYQAWLAVNDTLSPMLTPYVDFTAPTLYPPYAPDTDASFGHGLDHISFWHLGASDVLSYGGALRNSAGQAIPVIPFLGMRYYHDEGPAYLYKFVEPAFFTRSDGMLATLSAASGCEGAVYWDWGLFGSAYPDKSGKPAYANNGTDVWSASWPWIVATYEYFGTNFNRGLPAGSCTFTNYPGSAVPSGASLVQGFTVGSVPSTANCWAATASGYTYLEQFQCTAGQFSFAGKKIPPPEPTCVVGTPPATCAFDSQTLMGGGGAADGFTAAVEPAGTYCPSVEQVVGCDNGTLSPTGLHATCLAVPSITSFSPTWGPAGTVIKLTGNGFLYLIEGQINGGTWTDVTVISDTEATLTVPAGATSGIIDVANSHTVGKSSTPFTVGTAPATCTFGSHTLSGAGGTAPGYTKSVEPAGTYCPSAEETVTCENGVLTPAGALSGCYAIPSITSFSPTSGPPGTVVTLTGNGFLFLGIGQITGGTWVDMTVDSDTKATMTIPSGATSGSITVENIHYAGRSTGTFTVTP